jgi:glycosyltransferase involved in cell wall biosynthesis
MRQFDAAPRADKHCQVISEVSATLVSAEGVQNVRAMPARPPSVSVVIPCYNYGRYLRECVESVLPQDGVKVDVLIVDDASTDDSRAVAAGLASTDTRVKVLNHATNQGSVRTYNDGLALVTGTYAVLISADDMLTPGSLARACALMEAHPQVGLVYGRPLVIGDDRPRPRPATGPVRWTIWPGREWFEIRCRLTENCIRSPEAVMRTSLLQRLGLYRDELPYSGDLELWMRFALNGDVGYVAGPDQAYYRDHGTGMHRIQWGNALAEHQQISAAFEMIFHYHGNRIPNRSRAEAQVRGALGKRALRLACAAFDREPFDPAEVAALEEWARGVESEAKISQVRSSLRIRKTLGARLWRTLHPLHRAMTIVPRRWNQYHHRRLQRAGLLV